jgi:hypothetical protein
VAFFPTYPALVYLLTLTGLHVSVALLAVSNLCLLLATIAVAAYWRGKELSTEGTTWEIALLVLLLFPTTFFFRMAYSEATFILLFALVLLGQQRNWPLLFIAFLVGAATATRSVGVALVPMFCLHTVQRCGSFKDALLISGSLLPMTIWGLFAFSVFQAVAFGEPFAFIKTQASWDIVGPTTLANKLGALASWEPIWTVYAPGRAGYWRRLGSEVPVFNLQFLNPILFIGCCVLVGVGCYRKWLDELEVTASAIILVIAYLMRAYEMNMASQGRFASAVIPAYWVLGKMLLRLPPYVRGATFGLMGFLLGAFAAFFSLGEPFF